MVTLTRFLPAPNIIKTLGELRGAVTVSRLSKPIGGVTRLFLRDANRLSLTLCVDYNDVAFKFEVFGLIAEPAPWPSSTTIEVAQVRGWEVLQCLFRFEWQRPANPGEVPDHYEQIVGERGSRQEVPSSASLSAVSMVGIAFCDAVRERPIAVITYADDDPLSLCVFDEAEQIDLAIRGCEMVRTDNFEGWSAQLD